MFFDVFRVVILASLKFPLCTFKVGLSDFKVLLNLFVAVKRYLVSAEFILNFGLVEPQSLEVPLEIFNLGVKPTNFSLLRIDRRFQLPLILASLSEFDDLPLIVSDAGDKPFVGARICVPNELSDVTLVVDVLALILLELPMVHFKLLQLLD